jgi:hypothetical protein
MAGGELGCEEATILDSSGITAVTKPPRPVICRAESHCKSRLVNGTSSAHVPGSGKEMRLHRQKKAKIQKPDPQAGTTRG